MRGLLKKICTFALVAVMAGTQTVSVLADKTEITQGTPYVASSASSMTVKNLALSLDGSAAIDSNGNLWMWGDLGFNSAFSVSRYGENSPVPKQVLPDVKFSEISMGNTSSNGGGIDKDGHLWMWGHNTSGTLANGEQDMSTDNQMRYNNYSPIKVMTDKTFKTICVNGENAGAIDGEGNLWMWGNNSYRQLGVEDKSIFEPTIIMEGTKFTKIAIGVNMDHEDFCGAIDTDGRLWLWGSELRSDTFIQFMPGTKFVDISFEVYGGMALDSEGVIWDLWGPKLDAGDVRFKDIESGQFFNGAIDTDGHLWMCGSNEMGQLGNGTREDEYKLVMIEPNTTFEALDLGSDFSGAIDTSGNLWMWGSNAAGTIGNGKDGNDAYDETGDYSNAYVGKPIKVVLDSSLSKSISAGKKLTLKTSKKAIDWTSSNSFVADVKKSGRKKAIVTGKSKGTATIKAYTGKGSKRKLLKAWVVEVE
ncbi:MAG: Ig-like domain-containing protein [Lachnospiraceae bacterium]|nr:Ig-like domain-containing protein [Lachnospiraceae bacterium]